MRFVRFFFGAILWHVRAGLWYVGLAFRLFFAIGLDSSFNHGTDEVSHHFQCPIKRTYRSYLE